MDWKASFNLEHIDSEKLLSWSKLEHIDAASGNWEEIERKQIIIAVMDQRSVSNVTPVGVPKLAISCGSQVFNRNPYKHASRKSLTSFTVSSKNYFENHLEC